MMGGEEYETLVMTVYFDCCMFLNVLRRFQKDR